MGVVGAVDRTQRRHPVLRQSRFLTGTWNEELGLKDATWLTPAGQEMKEDDWHNPAAKCLGILLDGRAQMINAPVQFPHDERGHAESLVEAALRFAVANDAVSTVLVGYSTLHQLEYAARSVDKGPLSSTALGRLHGLQHGFVGEPR